MRSFWFSNNRNFMAPHALHGEKHGMWSERRMRATLLFTLALAAGAQVASSGASKGVTDWPMWGGSPDRNMVSDATGLPTTWDVKTGKNIKWVAPLGSQSYGNPVVAGGVVLVGTNNEAVRDPKQPGDRGVIMAFKESDG